MVRQFCFLETIIHYIQDQYDCSYIVLIQICKNKYLNSPYLEIICTSSARSQERFEAIKSMRDNCLHLPRPNEEKLSPIGLDAVVGLPSYLSLLKPKSCLQPLPPSPPPRGQADWLLFEVPTNEIVQMLPSRQPRQPVQGV